MGMADASRCGLEHGGHACRSSVESGWRQELLARLRNSTMAVMSNQYRLFEVRRVQCRTCNRRQRRERRAVYTFPRHRDSLHRIGSAGDVRWLRRWLGKVWTAGIAIQLAASTRSTATPASAALRKTYGEHFAKGRRKDMMLKNLLAETGTIRCTPICASTTSNRGRGNGPGWPPGGCRPFSVCALFRAALPAASATTRRICGNHGTKPG